jgi:hypothetical protein
MTARSELEEQVRHRADDRCEYCRMHQSLQGASFHLEHIIPCSRGGTSDLDNLAWACPGCNLRKSDRVDSVDPESGTSVFLFHPRLHAWHEHFSWRGFQIIGSTPIGRATIAVLDLNHPRRLRIRGAEQLFDLFPPRS